MAKRKKKKKAAKKWGSIGSPKSAKRKSHMKKIARKGRCTPCKRK